MTKFEGRTGKKFSPRFAWTRRTMCGSPVCFRYSTKSIEMNHLEIYAVTMIVLFISTFTRSTIGFGDAVIAMPVLAVILGVKTATPVVALVACVISISIVYKNRTSIDFQTVLPLVVSSLLGIPIGLLMLKGASETLMKTLLGFVVAGYGLFGLVKPPLTPMGESGKLNRSLRPGSFERYVHGFLLILGVALVIRTVA
jgi:uncharacterized membrane protein YfcA